MTSVHRSQPAESPALAEWRAHWPLVFVSWIGCTIIGAPFLSFGAFADPLERAYHWPHFDLALGLFIYAVVGVIGGPLAGRLLDFWGARRVALPGVVVTGLAFAAFGTMDGSLRVWLALWLLYALVGQLILMQVWAAAVASEFDAARGLALAITLTGSAVCAQTMPNLSVVLIEANGWRTAYAIIGITWAVVGGALVFLLFHSKLDRGHSKHRPSPESIDALTGISAREGLRSGTFAKLIVTAFASFTIFAGFAFDLVQILESRGLSYKQAAFVFSLLGGSAVVAKLICGALVTRVRGNRIMVVLVALPIVSCLMMMPPKISLLAGCIAVVFGGLSSGGQLEMLTYLTSRYFGMKAFGTIFGFIGGVLSLTLGVGPLIFGKLFDLTHSYSLQLAIGIPLSLISVVLMLLLGAPPEQDGGAPH